MNGFGRIAFSALLVYFSLSELTAQVVTSTPQSSRRGIRELLGFPATEGGKCGTGDLIIAQQRWNTLSPQVQARINSVLSRPERQKYRLTPARKFRMHYDTTGFEAPALLAPGPNGQRIPNTAEQFIDSLGAILDAVWRLQIDSMGYLPPPQDTLQGGGPEYDVYVVAEGAGMFGETVGWSLPSSLLESGLRRRAISWIELDNDFYGLRTSGMDGLRITVAHEFFHAIQVGGYGYWTNVPESDFYFYELTAVWMERVAYSTVLDYLYDLPDYFRRFRDSQNRSYSFTVYNTLRGYERSIWAEYLAKRFGSNLLRLIWEGMKADPVFASTAKVLHQYGTTVEAEFAQFSFWNYYTADRSQPGKYYDNAARWPRFTPNVSTTFGGMSSSMSGSAWPLSTQMYEFAIPGDTVIAVLANVNTRYVVDPNPATTDFALRLTSANPVKPYQAVAGNLWLSFEPSAKAEWRTLYLQSSSRSVSIAMREPFPNPVRLAVDTKVAFPLPGSTDRRASVFFLNGALELVMSREYDVTELFGGRYLYVPTGDLREHVNSGIYFVKVACGEKEFKWKVAVVR